MAVKEASARYLPQQGSDCPPGYQKTEVGVIPEDWVVHELGSIGMFKNGINKESDAFGHGFPLVNLMDVFGASSITSSAKLGLIASKNERPPSSAGEASIV